MKNLKIGSCVEEEGTKTFGTIKVTERFDGSPIEMPVVIISGTEPGPRLFTTGGIHGDEIGGIAGILKVIREIDPEELKGTFIATPCVNTTAFEARRRESPIDNKDLNRLFPGDPEGTFSEKLAYIYWNEFFLKITKEDYLIDCHSAIDCCFAPSFAEPKILEDKELEKKSYDLTESSLNPKMPILACVDVTKGHWEEIYMRAGGRGNLTVVAPREGITSSCIESTVPEPVYLGIMNAMKYLGMIEGSPIRPEKPINLRSIRRVKAKKRGLQMPVVNSGDIVSEGQTLLQVMDLYGTIIEEVKAPFAGMAVIVRNGGPVIPSSHLLEYTYGALMGKIE